MASFRSLLNELDSSPVTSGSVVRAFRKQLELTLKEVESLSGIKESNLSAIENDKREMTKNIAEQLAAVYGVQAWLILFPNGEETRDAKIAQIAKRSEKYLANRAIAPRKSKVRAVPKVRRAKSK